ncbi:MAG: hypothetical protein VXY00_05160 [Candidatus Latescibacterota bacterium]|nr:hypothetical protein [Candidatus Latescibacterota bacterium]MEE2626857.1 hypothetical protein [Candidatus Latescibacterota bacterium]
MQDSTQCDDEALIIQRASCAEDSPSFAETPLKGCAILAGL